MALSGIKSMGFQTIFYLLVVFVLSVVFLWQAGSLSNNPISSSVSLAFKKIPWFVQKPATRAAVPTGPRLRITCIIFTQVHKWPTKGIVVRATWSRHCDRRRFFYSRPANGTGLQITGADETVALNVSDGKPSMMAKVWDSFAYVHERFDNETDWYVRADDDSYIVWRRLVAYLHSQDPKVASAHGELLLGMPGVSHLPKGYHSGGGVIVLSPPAMRLMLSEGPKRFPSECGRGGRTAIDDIDLGDCLTALGVVPSETQDPRKRLTFFGNNPLTFLRAALNEGDQLFQQYYYAEYNGLKLGTPAPKKKQLLGNESITFHYLTPAEMLLLDFVDAL